MTAFPNPAGQRPPFIATVPGFPRIGAHRELKKAIEAYWRDPSLAPELANTAATLIDRRLRRATTTGLDSVPVGTFSYYDQMLDVAAMVGALPARVDGIADYPEEQVAESGGLLPPWLDRYFAAARGAEGIPPLEMTKWFDTNYHHLVPELDAARPFAADPSFLVSQVRGARRNHVPARPVLIGPVTFLALSKAAPGSPGEPLDRLPELVDVYLGILDALAAEGVEWVQLDEPALNTDRLPADRGAEASRQWRRLVAHAHGLGLRVLAQTYFTGGQRAVDVLAGTGVDAIGVDYVAGDAPDLSALPESTLIVAGVVDGRNVWRTDCARALATLAGVARTHPVAVSTSCSLLHVPHSLAAEPSLANEPELRARLAFGEEKIIEVVSLARALHHPDGQRIRRNGFLAEAEAAANGDRAEEQGNERERGARAPEHRVPRRKGGVHDRSPFPLRRKAQERALDLPPLPTSTIGSFPQTPEVRAARAAYARGESSARAYEAAMIREIVNVIGEQERLGLDVLVHGEPERNDMVQYFAEQLDGFHCTSNAWVQSYGTRCVRPPILHGDVSRPAPMTVRWFRAAQDMTERPVKGMLTGPVTMLAWSFVRDDQPLADTAHQVALAIRAECEDLEAAGAQVIQVDEAAIRELLPLRPEDRDEYAEWSVEAFRTATGGLADSTQLHTHMCYSDFGSILDLIRDMDADVTTIEAARAGFELVDAIAASDFDLPLGPGVWDIHSPRVPGVDEVTERIDHAARTLGPDRVWVVPDCGLKTRGWPETRASLDALVKAARKVRASL
ncbi:5-methyltetrahydropteroyltriglutamate--homocysteine S-methyltransferase [Corynebacterium hansenii]|uniref:5-methyltetrahydropteroyltriglutamate--homocysteine S-methyltransferase n=1 Tax=Corynebacterium hansenii TaxID=394964 RepID=A0ABV7ZSV6_9CORY|nr:5-methyltetrahydropteroyltriglutamate--homocysteine S-methyltransferase [Corynebacterium hansenii]WJZ00902.1 5-methyltetrahydropteroyltriglutamate--homocysteine methyltransferase [Corynebacterium hansenii]